MRCVLDAVHHVVQVTNLGEDHVTITKLAGENLSQKEQITAYEQQLELLQADNDGFEENLEEMVRANESLDLEIERITNERDELINSMTKELLFEKEQIKRAAEQLNLLVMEDGTGVYPFVNAACKTSVQHDAHACTYNTQTRNVIDAMAWMGMCVQGVVVSCHRHQAPRHWILS